MSGFIPDLFKKDETKKVFDLSDHYPVILNLKIVKKTEGDKPTRIPFRNITRRQKRIASRREDASLPMNMIMGKPVLR